MRATAAQANVLSCYRRAVTRDELEAYLARDWSSLAEVKTKWWRDTSPSEKLRLADELRKQVIAQNKDWPSEEDREEDLRTHERVSALLGQASRARRSAG